MIPRVTIVGAGLAGTECAFQLALRGVSVALLDQKPAQRSPAHRGDGLAELVCSNSLRGRALSNAVGLLKEEMRRCGSLVMEAAESTRVPAGGALAVDRAAFSEEVTRRIRQHPNIELASERVTGIPDRRPLVLATGPLTADELAADLSRAVGEEHLYYYDAIAPIVAADSIGMDRVFRASRYGKGEEDAYLNCPMNERQYRAFIDAILQADRIAAREFEQERFFEGCLPVEVMAGRGVDTLLFGPMKSIGLTDPRTGRRPHAVVQLRQENRAATSWNMVGFQTRLTHPEQKRVFSMIPGLENAEFERYGGVHRNTFVNAPRVLDDRLSLRALPGIHLAGQVTGVEGYVESAANGLCLGLLLVDIVSGVDPAPPPPTTALGALLGHLRGGGGEREFQPSNITWGMFPPLEDGRLKKRQRRAAMAERALADLPGWFSRYRIEASN
jgi:methylenetetrahydrofolate--tRNA-(uracil-5-)-methyltransferase